MLPLILGGLSFFAFSWTWVWTWRTFVLRHFPSKSCPGCFCGKLLGVMDVFLCCIIEGLHGALMTVPEPVATSLREDGFAVWMWECVIMLYVQHSERERKRKAWPRCFTVPCSGSNQGPWLKLCKSEIPFCWVIILSDKLSDLSLQKYVAHLLLHSNTILLYCVAWQIYDSWPVPPICDWSAVLIF